MKKTTLAFLLTIFIGHVIAQADKEDYSLQLLLFISWHFKEIKKSLVIAAYLKPLDFNHYKNILSKDTFYKRTTYNTSKTTTTDTLIFSKDERIYIDSFFSNDKNFNWHNGLLVANFISEHTIDSLENSRSLNSFLNSHYNVNHYFNLAKPIFLRNNTLCIFYENIIYGNAIFMSIVIYKKTGDNWQEYSTLYEALS